MKKLLIVIAALIVLAACKKEEIQPPCKRDTATQDSIQKWFRDKLIMQKP